jgi:hypothetical protein
MHARIEQIAEKQLQMQVPDAKRIQVVAPNKSELTSPEADKQP